MRSVAPVTLNRLSKPEDLMLENATPLRKSAPSPPNSSDEHVSCTAPATENASLQILFKCPTPAIIFETATKPSKFAHFWQGAESCFNVQKWYEHVVFLACWIRNVLRATTGCTFSTSQLSKELRHWSLFAHLGFELCFAPQRRALFQKLNFLKAPRIVFTILTSKRAPCHNSVHFFHISTSRSAPDVRCFVHFYFQMCFAPQRRAILHFSSA